MTDAKSAGSESAVPTPPKRGPGHRAPDVREAMAEMAAKAHEISQEAGTKMAAAMKDLISAAAGLAGFAVESARDLVQYMVRRGQMTQEEADKLIREVEAAQPKKKPAPPAAAPSHASAATKSEAPRKAAAPAAKSAPAKSAPAKPAPSKPAPAAKKSAAPSKTAPAKPPAKKTPAAAKKSAPAKSAKPASKPKKK